MATVLPVGGCVVAAAVAAGSAAAQQKAAIALPRPAASGNISVEEALARRESPRDYAEGVMPLTALGQRGR